MKSESRKGFKKNQSGRVTAFGILILIMLLISIYELGVIYADWNQIRMIGLKIRVLNEQRLPVSDVSFTINGAFAGFSNLDGKFTASISEAGEVEISARKKPFEDIDTTITLGEDGSSVVFSMNRPYATLTVVTLDEEGGPLKDVDIAVEGKDQGRTGEDGGIEISKFIHIFDTIGVSFKKNGYDEVSEQIYLSEVNNIDSFTMVKSVVASRPAPTPPPKPKAEPQYQTYVNRASGYLDRAIAGESKYFGRALTEIEKAIKARPKSIPAKQLKVEILFNFAKSLRDSNLPYEAANRLGEALKMYRDIPQDPLYNEVYRLKAEIDKELGG